MKCKADKLDGAKCQAYTMHGSQFCFRHNQATRRIAIEASSNGGKAKRKYSPGYYLTLQTSLI